MTHNIIPFKRPATNTASGAAKCLACAHQWKAVVESDDDGRYPVDLECPNCKTMRGVFCNPFDPGEPFWQCPCGNDLYYYLASGWLRCAKCGTRGRPW